MGNEESTVRPMTLPLNDFFSVSHTKDVGVQRFVVGRLFYWVVT
jgi:hypothetical protein